MSNVKAQYQDIMNILEDNKNKKVSTILPQIMELVTTKQKSRTFIKDDEGNILAIYCYYHKRWERLDECEYGKKASSSHGYNTMCKEGTSQWTKQQREAKKAKEQLLTQLANGEITQDELTSLMDEIEEQRTRIIPREDGLGAIDEQA